MPDQQHLLDSGLGFSASFLALAQATFSDFCDSARGIHFWIGTFRGFMDLRDARISGLAILVSL